eukprot:365337-Chlamydomonas_euryale.AAC.6
MDPPHLAAHACRWWIYARKNPVTPAWHRTMSERLGALGEGTRPLLQVERSPGTERGHQTPLRLSCGIPTCGFWCGGPLHTTRMLCGMGPLVGVETVRASAVLPAFVSSVFTALLTPMQTCA